ncbi:nickel pincer cofactor biosynthesis protein LarC [Paenibacillus alkalitolerans]|uniref:LarC family nickel insertion protein n=1 Tax=Paenibacillus alkalitolerans TaxID=2799335 RepID=UPI0018F51FE9|nr:LarC family nickel insertion protein [Paenibacillus alkalitolerans]
MRILYLDCFSGISGDMTLASLVDLGADSDYIERELQKLNVDEYTLSWSRVVKKGIAALKADVLVHDRHDHHKHEHEHEHEHEHHDDRDRHHHGHEHKHSHSDQGDHGHHHHRHYADIVKLIENAGLSTRTTQISLAIFEKIGAAEAKIHNIPMDRVHFHEVGAVDSIVDIVGVALAIDNLNPDFIVCSPVPLGSGSVRIDHGIYPVPAPATLEMMRGLPVAPSPHAVELTTPTGAGIVSAVVNEFSPSLPPMVVEAIGYGAGTRDLPNQPNVLRTVLGFAEKRIGLWPATHSEHVGSHHQEHEHHHREQ